MIDVEMLQDCGLRGKDLLLKVKETILQHPEQADIHDWNYESRCGTVGCIAGWCCFLAGRADSGHFSFSDTAIDLLENQGASGLSDVEPLFYTSGWPEELSDAISGTSARTLEHAELIAKAIDAFIESPEEFGEKDY